MSALAATPAMSLGGALLADGLRAALDALRWLDAAGIGVRQVSVRGRTPLLRLDAPPCPGAHRWLRGALHKRVTRAGVTRTVYVTRVMGAAVEWETSEGAGR